MQYYNWKEAPDWAMWAARDSNGMAWWFEDEPYLDPLADDYGVEWFNDGQRSFKCNPFWNEDKDWDCPEAEYSKEYRYNFKDSSENDLSSLSLITLMKAIINKQPLEVYEYNEWADVKDICDQKISYLLTKPLRVKVKLSIKDKRKALIEKLLENKIAVLCKCWNDEKHVSIQAVVKVVNAETYYPYRTTSKVIFKYACAIDDNGNEITLETE